MGHKARIKTHIKFQREALEIIFFFWWLRYDKDIVITIAREIIAVFFIIIVIAIMSSFIKPISSPDRLKTGQTGIFYIILNSNQD